MLDSEDKYRLLLQVSEAANGQLEFAGVLDAVARALTPIVPLDAIGVVSLRDERVRIHAIHTELKADFDPPNPKTLPGPEGYPVAGSGTEFVGKTGKAYVCQDLEAERLFTEDDRLYGYGTRAYVRAPLFVRDRLIGSIAFLRR